MQTLFLLISIVGFMAIVAVVFFGGFVVLDYIWGRLGGDP